MSDDKGPYTEQLVAAAAFARGALADYVQGVEPPRGAMLRAWNKLNGAIADGYFDTRAPGEERGHEEYVAERRPGRGPLIGSCEERTYVGGMEERAAFREAILAGIGAINAGHYDRAVEILQEPLRTPDQPRTVLYSEVSDPTNFNPTGGVIEASTEER